MEAIQKSLKLGFVRWETGVQIGRVVYYLQGWTKAGSLRKATQFYIENYNNPSLGGY